ncbi:sulfatase-like hydrolase/transferase [Rhodococcus artemisiae]|uniref:Sulfatase-like hydrolase/transferase n=1 Tax=Rhodococcus artemisiae TaxID=714159 RepID=A0ABU7L956_9NOCA|nr:sulfatase-like hydrolase/transferase [Rhodococcus artemisiae]MEE2058076.1 sulfatase-like hydrolase/transferase [Rhodococcus artemisiae]
MALCASALLTGVTVACAGPAESGPAPSASQEVGKPNILMVLIDDLGYTDLGPYGGEAATPNIDDLTQEGVQFSNFHAYPVCAPTRAALMTGQDPHRVGLGSMEGFAPAGVPPTTPGYRGSLEGEYTGIAEVLSDADYATYQVGKWHLGEEPEQTPQALGFDQNFTMYNGAASHYADMLRHAPGTTPPEDTVHYERNGERVDDLPADFYSTHAYTDEMLRMIDQGQDSEGPFFGYLAYTAVHDPLQAPDTDLIDHYLDLYRDSNNYNELRAARLDRLSERGLIDPDVATRWPTQTPDWNTLTPEQQYDLAYRMAVYAAMIQDVDTQVGRLTDHLKEVGEYDKTLIVLASDNGAAGSSRELYTSQPGSLEWQNEHYPLAGEVEAYGRPGSYATLGLPNAQVSSGPFFNSKTTVFEGGTRVPAIVKTPLGDDNVDGDEPRVVDTFAHISDLYPTFAEYAGANLENPGALLGDSAKALLDGTSDAIGDDEFGMEMFGHRVYRDGDWKLVFAPTTTGGSGSYSLYDLGNDPGETVDLIDAHPDIAQQLADRWDQYASDNGVVPATFEAVNADAPRTAGIMYSIDWAE